MTTAKERIQRVLDELPDDASADDLQYQIYLRLKVREGIEAADRGDTLTQAEVEHRAQRWLQR